MQRALDVLFRAADTPASVLILGESGTGKSVLARAVHQHSNIKDQAFVTVSCPSLSRELLESELFGHVKGSFTGALKDTWGKVAAAQDGALFLDEIGELPMEIQPKLLRLLQERQYERVGENTTRTASVRVIAATNRNLEDSVRAGSFREDLFYRLNVITVTIPPLRERPLDLIRLSRRYLEHFSREMQRPASTFSPEALAAIQAYSWPGNLRELRNVIERSVILARSEALAVQDLPDTLHSGNGTSNGISIHPGSLVTIDELEGEHIRRVIAQTESLESAYRILGIDPATLYRKRKKMNL
jgi:NtrC-family two-component system response regulator AlgB